MADDQLDGFTFHDLSCLCVMQPDLAIVFALLGILYVKTL